MFPEIYAFELLFSHWLWKKQASQTLISVEWLKFSHFDVDYFF